MTKIMNEGWASYWHSKLMTEKVCTEDDILDFAKIESGRIEFEQLPFSPRRLTAEVHRLFRIEAERKGLRLEDRNQVPENLRLLGDPSRLRQVLVNLVHNALKFTADGFVEIRTRVERAGSRVFHRLVIEVADSGEGIDPRQRARIFERFRQADVSVSRRYGGTGLGLSISRSLALLMGGELRVESEPEVGSTFVLEVDLEEGGDSSSIRRAVRGPKRTFRGKVLLVEDNEVNRTVATAMLRNLGLAVEVAVDGREGVEKAVAGNYDLILMDLRMPVLDGLAAARRISTERDPPPIVALTANVTEEDRRRCREAGMHDLVGKPLSRVDLVECLEGVLGDTEPGEGPDGDDHGR